jgi:hypothetical protein
VQRKSPGLDPVSANAADRNMQRPVRAGNRYGEGSGRAFLLLFHVRA